MGVAVYAARVGMAADAHEGSRARLPKVLLLQTVPADTPA